MTPAKAKSATIDANTKISISILVILVGACLGGIRMSYTAATYFSNFDNRLTRVEERVDARPDPWSGTMEKDTMQSLEREIRKNHPAFIAPNIRQIQMNGIRYSENKRK